METSKPHTKLWSGGFSVKREVLNFVLPDTINVYRVCEIKFYVQVCGNWKLISWQYKFFLNVQLKARKNVRSGPWNTSRSTEFCVSKVHDVFPTIIPDFKYDSIFSYRFTELVSEIASRNSPSVWFNILISWQNIWHDNPRQPKFSIIKSTLYILNK